MKLEIKSEDCKLALNLPLTILKFGFLRKKIFKDKLNCKEVKNTIKILKKFVKENGHFYLVDIVDEGGENIKIRI